MMATNMVRNLRARAALACALLACAGCIPPPQTAPSPFIPPPAADPAQYASFSVSGEGSIAGQAFLMTRGGDAKRAAGRAVTLDPVTDYSREWFERLGMSIDRFDTMSDDSLFRRAHRATQADADGRFQFTGLPAGRYLVRTTVTWEAPGTYGLTTQGGIVSAVVVVPAGHVDVIMSEEGDAFGRPAKGGLP